MLLSSLMRIAIGCGLLCVLGLSTPASAEDLILDGGTMSLAGIKRYDHVCLINGATRLSKGWEEAF